VDYGALLNELYALERFGIKLGLDVIRDLLGRMGSPQRAFPSIHVTGTNGKGSVCAFLASIFRSAGYRVGLYTSPHLVKFNERIRVDGRLIRDEEVASLYEDIRVHAAAMAKESDTNRPTFFEVTTAMAFRHFADTRVDLAVVEVGMGGRLDATNVLTPATCVITRIGLEHTEHLGRTVERIAKEKAGILKPSVPAVTVEQPALGVLQARADELRCPLTVVGRDVRYARGGFGLDGQEVRIEDGRAVTAHLAMIGSFQPENAATAYAAAVAVGDRWTLADGAIEEGLSAARWPGRLQVARRDPLVLVDAAHNAPAARALAESLRELFPGKKLTFVVGILNDKDVAGMAAALGPLAANIVATRAKTPRAFDPEELRRAFEAYAPVTIVPDVRQAVTGAIDSAATGDVLVVAGSVYTVGETLDMLGGWE